MSIWRFTSILGAALIASNALATDVADSESVLATDAAQEAQTVESDPTLGCNSYYYYYIDNLYYNSNLCAGNRCYLDCSCASGYCTYYC